MSLDDLEHLVKSLNGGSSSFLEREMLKLVAVARAAQELSQLTALTGQ